MEYLNHVLGISTLYLPDTVKSLPNFIYARYKLKVVTLDGKKAVFIYAKEELESIKVIKNIKK